MLHFKNRPKAVEPIYWSSQSGRWISHDFNNSTPLVDNDGNPFRTKNCDNIINFQTHSNNGYGVWQSLTPPPVTAVTAGSDGFLRVEVLFSVDNNSWWNV